MLSISATLLLRSRRMAFVTPVMRSASTETGLTPYPFQEEAINRLLAPGRRGLLLADEMGLGKTVSVISALNREERIEKVLVIAPKSVLPVWRYELSRWLERPLTVDVATAKRGMPKERPDVLLINYDVVSKYREELAADGAWDVIVCDEAHYLKSPDTIRTSTILGETTRKATRDEEAPNLNALPTRRVWFLTGSPVLNNPIELYPLLRSLDPYGETMPTLRRYTEFRERYCRKQMYGSIASYLP